MNELEVGIRVNGQLIKNIINADDHILLANSADCLQNLMNNMLETCNECGLELEFKD